MTKYMDKDVLEKFAQIDAVISTMGSMMQEFKDRLISMGMVIETNGKVTLTHYAEAVKTAEGLETVVQRLDGYEREH